MNRSFVLLLLLLISVSCGENENTKAVLGSMDLKRGEVIYCNPENGKLYGSVTFSGSVPENLRADFNTGIALLYSFEYDESEKMFAKVIDQAPDCALAYWGVAMSNFHPLWAPPAPSELEKGKKAVEIARSIEEKTKRERDYIEAIAKFYDSAQVIAHKARVLKFEKAMENVYRDYPEDLEAAVIYSLALNASADPTDKTYTNQKKAVGIIDPLFQKNPEHPGLAHYIIHNFDYPALAELALPAARKYASIAPASAHAQHMPSHIFTRLGLWDEGIKSNLVSVSSAQCYATQANIKGHWDEELHALDYLVYGYLQKAEDELARQQVEYLKSIEEVHPQNFKTAYAFAAIPSRYLLERKNWKEAAELSLHTTNQEWEKYPWQKSIVHFTRLLGSVNSDNVKNAEKELAELKKLHEVLESQKEKQKEAHQVAVQLKAGEAWILFRKGKNAEALDLMNKSVLMEEGMEKHPVTPGEVIPARELLAEMLIQMNKPELALEAFEEDLKTHPNRFNALYGAGMAAEKAGNTVKAMEYFNKLDQITARSNSKRPELVKLRARLLK